MSNKNSWFMSHLYLLGFLGFMGLLYFKFYETSYLMFFTFFGFFGWKWSLKYAKDEKDAKDINFLINRNKAYLIGLRTSATIVLSCMFLLESYLCQSLSVETKYAILVAVLSLGFALCLIVCGYLLDKYEKESRNVGLNSETGNEINKEQLNSNVQ